jgi:hypothetical protein
LEGRGYKINNGKVISFWLDIWLNDKSICIKYPILYELCTNQNSSIHDVAMEDWVVQFKVRLPPLIREQWYDLDDKLNNVTLNKYKDKVI